MVRHAQWEALASEARTATANSAARRIDDVVRITIHSIVSDFTSGTLDVKPQVSNDGTNWSDLSWLGTDVACDQQSGTGAESCTVPVCAKYLRIVATGASTPVYTNQVVVDLHREDL